MIIFPAVQNQYVAAGGGGSNGLLTGLLAVYELQADGSDSHGSYGLSLSGSAATHSTGVIGSCFAGMGANRYTRSNDIFTGTGAMSMAGWVKQSSVDPSGAGAFAIGGFSSRDTIICGIESGGVLTLRFFGGSATFGSGYADGNWHHIVVAKPSGADGFGCSVYVDGSSVSRSGGSNTSSSISIGSTSFLVGYGNIGGSAKDVDELCIWSKALSATDASNLYNSGSGLAYASFD